MEFTSGNQSSWTALMQRAARNVVPLPGVALFGPRVPTVTPAAAVGAGCRLNSAKFVTYQGEQWFEINATATAGASNYFELQMNTVTEFTCDCLSYEFQTDDLANLSNAVAYLGTSGYSVFATDTRAIGTPSNNDPFRSYGTMTFTHYNASFAKNGFTGSLTDQAWINAKVRMTVANGTSAVVRFRSMTAGAVRNKGRLCISVDDGYDSVYRLGWPVLTRYGFPFSMGIIADKVGKSGYMTLDNLVEITEAGNECVAHGPIGGSGNLFTGGPAYLNDAERIADMKYHRDYLITNGLTTDSGAQCYIWPQGRYSDANGSASTLTAAQAAGFVLGRAATEYSEYTAMDAMAATNQSRMILPIIGHSYAGVANTPDDGTETANIATIVGRIQAVAEARMDGILMLHKFVARGAADNEIMIEMDRLVTICDAVKTLVSSGTLDVVLLSDIAA